MAAVPGVKLDSRDQLLEFLTHLAEYAPGMLKAGEPQFNPTILSFWLGKDLAWEFELALNSIRVELVPRHAVDVFLLNSFWDDLVCVVASSAAKYLDAPEALESLVAQFGGRWKPALQEYKVVYAVKYLAVGPEPAVIGDVEFFPPTDGALAERSISKELVSNWLGEEDIVSLAVTTIMATEKTIFEAGRETIVEALELLRLAALMGLSHRGATDELMQWRLTGNYLAFPTSVPSTGISKGYQRTFRPLVIPLGPHIKHGIENWGLEGVHDLPEEIRERLMRAIHWISHSTTHETDDHRFVDLCTSLEILLLPDENYGEKGSPIALRYCLLGGSLNPPAVKMMYDWRNHIIHGNRLPVVGPRDTWDLRHVCFTTIGLIIGLSRRHPDVDSLAGLIRIVETRTSIEKFIDRADRGMFEGSLLPKIVTVAKTKLKRL